VEGAEYEVLKGAQNILANSKDISVRILLYQKKRRVKNSKVSDAWAKYCQRFFEVLLLFFLRNIT
jgi:hypothetical protein